MDQREAELLKDIDPAELGQRLRAARVAKGWTQSDLAGPDISVGYVSRIESGQRRPNSAVLTDLAARLGMPVDHLLRGVSAREYDEIRLTLDFAELSLETGQHLEAETQASQALDRAVAASQTAMVYRAQYLIARALEGQGSLDDAILRLEPLVATKEDFVKEDLIKEDIVLHIKAAIALCRCYRESGDFNQAIEVGERTLARLSGGPLEGTDETVQMAVTLASAYFERGDTGQAVRTCRRAVAKAELLDSPSARASAYWNASMMEALQGSVHNAIPLAERALVLLAEGSDARNLARLRTQLGILQLRLDPPAVAEAQEHLEQAARELTWCSASTVEVARNDLALARASFIHGDIDQAEMASAEIHDRVQAEAPLLAADAKSLEGQAAAARGDISAAQSAYRQAVFMLSSAGADRGAAQLWFEIAGLLEEVGESGSALVAYRSAAACSGLRSNAITRAATLTSVFDGPRIKED